MQRSWIGVNSFTEQTHDNTSGAEICTADAKKRSNESNKNKTNKTNKQQ